MMPKVKVRSSLCDIFNHILNIAKVVEKERDELKEEVGRLKRQIEKTDSSANEIMDLKFKIEEIEKELQTTKDEKDEISKHFSNICFITS